MEKDEHFISSRVPDGDLAPKDGYRLEFMTGYVAKGIRHVHEGYLAVFTGRTSHLSLFWMRPLTDRPILDGFQRFLVSCVRICAVVGCDEYLLGYRISDVLPEDSRSRGI
jgi:hypothetical protein